MVGAASMIIQTKNKGRLVRPNRKRILPRTETRSWPSGYIERNWAADHHPILLTLLSWYQYPSRGSELAFSSPFFFLFIFKEMICVKVMYWTRCNCKKSAVQCAFWFSFIYYFSLSFKTLFFRHHIPVIHVWFSNLISGLDADFYRLHSDLYTKQ